MSELSEAKKQAEVEADEAWSDCQEAAKYYFSGDINRKAFEEMFLIAQHAINIERGLRHEKED